MAAGYYHQLSTIALRNLSQNHSGKNPNDDDQRKNVNTARECHVAEDLATNVISLIFVGRTMMTIMASLNGHLNVFFILINALKYNHEY